MTSATFDRNLPRTPDSPWLARRAVTEWFGAVLDNEQLNLAKLLTSELVTNAILHGRGQITLRGRVDGDRVLVEVLDQGDGFVPEVRRQGYEDLGARGLVILDAEASRWGIREGATNVWFELERPGPRLGTEARPA